LTALLAGFANVTLLWLGGLQVLKHSMTAGQLMALNSMLNMMLAPLDRLANANPAIQDAIAASERLGDVLDCDLEIQNERQGAVDRHLEGAIEFRDVEFTYNGRRTLYERLNLRIEAGECVGIAGESGCGKTTLGNLLGRFLEPSNGSIAIDDI